MKKNETKKTEEKLYKLNFHFWQGRRHRPLSPCYNIHNFLIFKNNICLYVDKFTTRASVNILG